MGLPIPEGFHAVNVYIVVGDSVEALALYEKAFGAQTRMRMPGPTERERCTPSSGSATRP